MPTRWLGNSLAPGESELRSRPRGKGAFPQTLPGTLRTESTPVLYIASSDGLVEIQFHIFNYQFSWGGEESSPHLFLAGCWTPIAAWALPCTIYPFGLVALPPPGKGQVQGPGALLSPMHLHAHLHSCPGTPNSGEGSHREGWRDQSLYLFKK